VLALIGGKSKDSKENKIEKILFSFVNKKTPKVLFCPYASINKIDSTINKFKELVKGIDCEIINLTLDNINKFDELLNTSDILYISGGISDDLVNIFKEYKLDKILEKYINSDKILIGSSAGAMLLTKVSMGDKYMFSDNYHNYNYKMVDCLGLINISICPHYQNEDLIIYNDEIRKYNLPSFGIEEDTCLVIDKNKLFVLKDYKNKSIYYFDNNNHYKMIPLYEGVEYEKDSMLRS